MPSWKPAYDRRNWDDVENWWRACDDPDGLRDLLQQLQRDVPKIKLENGIEEDERHVFPDEAPEQWRGAAEILFLGELEAKVLRDPADEVTQWAEISANIADKMQGFLAAQEVTQGHRALSRAAHAETALAFLQTIERETAAMCDEIDPNGENPTDREWLLAVIAQAAVAAFNVGVHARAAAGKEIETNAVRGEKTLMSAQEGGRVRSAATNKRKADVIAKMSSLIGQGHSMSNAAKIAFNQGLGTSGEANRKAFNRHRLMEK